ncbi:MAG: amino acid ABC transporter permease [Oscillospiraceae bacterium]|nr:amino acid ABC transporter permease [Oscillospiraceae bacterium]
MTFRERFVFVFIEDDRWKRHLLTGLGRTLLVTLGALAIGVAIGLLISIVRVTHDKQIGQMRRGVLRFLLRFFNRISIIYLTVIRGTPVVVQLLIAFFVIFISSNNKMMVAIITFGVNSGAYVAEIIRGGIMSIDSGQFEAGRSLGFGYIRTMWFIITPQAFKNILPSLANEFIVLLKETSIAGYIGFEDLAKGGDIIRGRTFDAFLPLIAVALVYLVLVIFFTWLTGKLERRLRSSDN